MDKKIFIGVPTRNQGWILGKHIESMFEIDYPKELIDVFFFANDCEDNTLEILEKYKSEIGEQYHSFIYENRDYGKIKDERTAKVRNQLYQHFANIKNGVRYMFLRSECDYWLHVDTDILFDPQIIKKFLKYDKDYICGVCNVNIDQKPPIYSALLDRHGNRVTEKELKGVHPIETYWVGGISFISRRAAAECSYHCPIKTKDDNLGFCCDVREKLRKKVWVAPDVVLEHYMKQEVICPITG